MNDQGSAVVTAFAAQLNLTAPLCTWHGERDRIVEIASVLGLVVGNLGKIARDWSLLMQTEVGEVFEPTGEGRGGSSTMPHSGCLSFGSGQSCPCFNLQPISKYGAGT